MASDGEATELVPRAGGNCYGATKAFVRQFSHGMRADMVCQGGNPPRLSGLEGAFCFASDQG